MQQVFFSAYSIFGSPFRQHMDFRIPVAVKGRVGQLQQPHKVIAQNFHCAFSYLQTESNVHILPFQNGHINSENVMNIYCNIYWRIYNKYSIPV